MFQYFSYDLLVIHITEEQDCTLVVVGHVMAILCGSVVRSIYIVVLLEN